MKTEEGKYRSIILSLQVCAEFGKIQKKSQFIRGHYSDTVCSNVLEVRSHWPTLEPFKSDKGNVARKKLRMREGVVYGRAWGRW